MKIEKKILPEWFQKILDGEKTYEFRLADFECNPGDILVLREIDPKTKQFTGRSIEKNVGYVGKVRIDDNSLYSKEQIEKLGFQIISLK